MYDKIEFSCVIPDRLLTLIEHIHIKKNMMFKYSVGKYGYLNSFKGEMLQIFFNRQESETAQGEKDAFVSIGSRISNLYGLNILKRLIRYGVSDIKLTRLDICCDITGLSGKDFKIYPFITRKRPGASKPKSLEYRNAYMQDIYDTAYFKTSDVLIRCYDKQVEMQEALFDSEHKRFEIQFKKGFLKKYMMPREYAGEPIKHLNKRVLALISQFSAAYQFEGEVYNELLKRLSEGTQRARKYDKIQSEAEKKMYQLKKQFLEVSKLLVIRFPEEFEKILNDKEYAYDYYCRELTKRL